MSYLVQKQRLIKLNRIFDNNEYFTMATSTDSGCINQYNMLACSKTVEIYAYIYKHPELVDKLFDSDNYKAHNTIKFMIESMIKHKLTAAQICKQILES